MRDKNGQQKAEEKTFINHLDDLRRTIFKILYGVAGALVVSVVLIGKIFYVLRLPIRRLSEDAAIDPLGPLIVLGPQKGFVMMMKVALTSALILSAPLSLYFIAQYILPALTRHEKRLLLPTFTVGSLLFIGGIAFSYFITLPLILNLLWRFNVGLGLENMWNISEYLGLTTRLMLATGIVFEMPLVLVILVKLDIISVESLRKKRRHAIIAIFITSAFLTPPDAPSMLMVSMPMLILYEASIWVSTLITRKKAKERKRE